MGRHASDAARARSKQQFPAHSYLEHARGVYAARGWGGFYSAGADGVQSWGRPNLLPGSSQTVAVIALSSLQVRDGTAHSPRPPPSPAPPPWASSIHMTLTRPQGAAVLATFTTLRRGADELLPPTGDRHNGVARAVLGGAGCGGLAGCVGAVFSLPRDLLTNLCLADDARALEHSA